MLGQVKTIEWVRCSRGLRRMKTSLTHTTGFHDRWKDSSSAYPAALPEQHAFWTQVTRPSYNAAKKKTPDQAAAGSNAAIKERV